MREEEIIQIISAQAGWHAYGHDEQGAEFLSPVACWALVESSGSVRHVVGLTAHGSGSVERAEDLPGFAEYRLIPEGGRGVSDRRIGADGERRLREAGFVPEASPTGKQRWQDPQTGRMIPGANALEEVKRREARDLEEGGWEREEIEGETYWRRPDSGRLYPRGPAHDLLKNRE